MSNESNITNNAPRQRTSLLAMAPSGPQLGIVFGLAAALAIGVGIVMWAMKPSYTPLYGTLAERDSAEVADALRAQNIQFEIDKHTGLILVPSDKVRELRMRLAADGLPQGTSVGLELLQKDQSLGTSQFMESARYQHALETELSRTIAGMRNVETARLHLAIPKQSVFVRKRAKVSASVMVKLFAGRVLEEGQVAAIVHLVASSIPYLESSDVTIVDQWGRLLTSTDASDGMGLTHKQFAYTRKLESTYEQRIEDLLTPIVGRGGIKAKVNAAVDYSQNERTVEQFEPDQAQVRSEQIQDQRTQGPMGAMGIPGALSNQPPAGGTLDPNAVEGEQGRSANVSKNATRNYELDKTITHSRLAQGDIKRLSVAVIVDDRVSVNDQGETVRTPLEPSDVEMLTGLVREAIGFDADRGDSVVVTNRSFQANETLEPVDPPAIWEQPWVWDVAKQVLAGLVVLFVLFGIVRPALRSLSAKQVAELPAAEGETADAEVGVSDDKLTLTNDNAGQLPSPPQVYGDILNLARAMAADDPKRVATVVKNWVAADA